MAETTQITARDPQTTNARVHAGLLGAWVASYPSPNTRASYTRDAQLFCQLLDAGGVDLLAATRAHLDVFARARTAAGDADTTAARRLAAVSAFYTYAITVDAVKRPGFGSELPEGESDHAQEVHPRVPRTRRTDGLRPPSHRGRTTRGLHPRGLPRE